VRHPLPHVQSGIDASGHRALDEALGVGEEHLIVPDLHTQRR